MSIRDYKKPFVSGIVFFLTVTTLSIAYGALNFIVSMDTASVGSPLSFVEWNKMISNFAALDSQLKSTNTTADNALATANTAQTALNSALPGIVPTGAVMAFYGTLCPTGWAPADGALNGVKKTDGTTATLDLRGEFIRGVDNGRGVDASRVL